MTTINRALHKAYKRRSAETGPELEQRHTIVSGWASKLREPIRPVQTPDGIAATPVVAAGSGGSLALPVTPRQAVGAPADLPVPPGRRHPALARVDGPHAPANKAGPSRQVAASSTVEKNWAWPPIVEKLLTSSAGAELRKLAEQLQRIAGERGLSCLALSGPGRATGRTSLVLTLARMLTEAQSARVAIVDADFGHPGAAQLISARPQTGLWEAACEATDGTSAVTTLVPGKLAIVPLVGPVAHEAIDRRKIGVMQSFLRSLRREYDMVLVDAGPWESLVPPLVFECRAIDAMICVNRCGSAHEEQFDDETYHHPGVEWLGMIETFAPANTTEH